MLPKLQLPLTVERQVQLWFQPDSDSADWLSPQCFPYAAWQYDEDGHFYAFPDFGHGVKVAHHRGGQMTSPQTIQRDVDDQDVQSIRTLLQRYLPSVNGPLKSHAVCMYTNRLLYLHPCISRSPHKLPPRCHCVSDCRYLRRRWRVRRLRLLLRGPLHGHLIKHCYSTAHTPRM